jgi:iron complex transport system ATP-binding protein
MDINEVTFSYDKKTDHLKAVSCQIETGRITTIIGPNGCGKSTLLGVMSQHNQPSSGQVILDGKAIHSYKPKELAKKLAVVHQHNDAPADLTVEKLVGFGRMPYKTMFAPNSDEDTEAVEQALLRTNLQNKRKLTIDQLSGGRKPRTCFSMSRQPIWIFITNLSCWI